MKPDQEIDHLLRSLGTAEPDARFEERLLARLSDAPGQRSKREAWWPTALAWSGGLALASVLGLLFVAGERKAPAPVRVAVAAPGLAASAPVPRAVRLLPAVGRPAAGAHGTDAKPVATREPTTADLPSMLAPEAPLTEQERVLARIARGPEPDDFALLNPDTREKLARQSHVEFDKLFPKPTPQEIYLATHIEN